MTLDRDVLGLLVALGIGLLVGGERERRKGEGPARASAGIRTFALAALFGAIAIKAGGDTLLAVATAAVLLLIAIGYALNDRQDPGLTTELALVLTVPLGALAMREPWLAAAIAVIVAIILAARTSLHHFVKRVLSEQEVHSALTFAAASLVILPVVPNRSLGPYDAINPHTLWLIVVLMMAVSAGGYIAIRTLGAGHGLPLAGLASGFVSSAATIAAMGARAKATPTTLSPCVAGAVLSTVATVVQLALLLALTSPSTLLTMAVPLTAAGVAAILYAALYMSHTSLTSPADEQLLGKAFDLVLACKLSVLLAVVLIVSAALTDKYGNAGTLIAAAVAGLADTHAPAISIARLVEGNKLSSADAAQPILLAMSANTITKAVLAYTSGGHAFAVRVIPGLAVVIAAAWLGAAMS
jgi:uncharacterized membrane protein (DUF4010 family)